jgi:hypothetical protein
LLDVFDGAQRRQIDPEMLCRVGGREPRRQYLRDERPQQMRPAVDQTRQRLRPQRPGRKIGHSPLGAFSRECRRTSRANSRCPAVTITTLPSTWPIASSHRARQIFPARRPGYAEREYAEGSSGRSQSAA